MGTESEENTDVTPEQGLLNYKNKRASVALEITVCYLQVKVPQGALEPLKQAGPSSDQHQSVVTSRGSW